MARQRAHEAGQIAPGLLKRLNPETGKVFKQGDVREDGFVFMSYVKSNTRPDGTYWEQWYSPERWAHWKVWQRDNKKRISDENKKWLQDYKMSKGCPYDRDWET